MRGMKKTREGLVDAVAEARDEALVEIGREAAQRQEKRMAKARRRTAGKMALAAAAAGAAVTAGALVLRRRRLRKEVAEIPLSGKPETPK